MNNDRRKQIAELRERAERIREDLESIKESVECIRDDEQEYFDNMPESLQGGEKGDRATAAVDELDNAIACFDEACDQLESVVSHFESASE